MKSKRSILGELTRDELASWTSFYELDVADRRVRHELVEALAHSKKARLADILVELSRDRLKEICRGLGLSDRGRAKATLVERLTGRTERTAPPSGKAGSASTLTQTEMDLGESESGASSKSPRGNGQGTKLTATLVDRGSKVRSASSTRGRPSPSSSLASRLPAGPAGTKMALRRLSLEAASGFRGQDAGVDFSRALIGCFGWAGDDEEVADADVPEEVLFDHPISTLDGGKRNKRTVAAYWPARRVLVEVVERDLMLDMAWKSLQVACLQMEAEPQYVVLTNQRDVRLYDLARDRTTPRLTISVDELPKYSEAFPFFATDWSPGATPKIINVDKVSQEVADLVAKVYRALVQKNPGRQEDAITFTLQCIVAMFAEDIGLLPKEYFTTLLYQAAEEGDAMDRIGALFLAMSTEHSSRGDNAPADIPFFNGGLFTDPVSLELGPTPLRALTKAAEANWTFVDPHIFGSVFQGIMGDAERHASGAHYTAREDIMSVVGPTIVEPWRERISAASTLADLQAILTDLGSYRVLDPACGSGNFLYVAFRELYRLETEVLCHIAQFVSMQSGKKQLSWASAIRTTNFFGIDINPFAVELAKTTLNIAKKIAFEERKQTVQELFTQGFLEVDPSLPLDNLDDNVVCADALFTDWPEAGAIVGNPPFLGGRFISDNLGEEYSARLRARYPDVAGLSDFCVYWFRRAHSAVLVGASAGLIATSSIRKGHNYTDTLAYIVSHGGVIVSAIAEKHWPGAAAVRVSAVTWQSTAAAPKQRHLTTEHGKFTLAHIPPTLDVGPDVNRARNLRCCEGGTAQGVVLGTKEAFFRSIDASEIASDPRAVPLLRPVANGSDFLSNAVQQSPKWCLYFGSMTETEAKSTGRAFDYASQKILPAVRKKGERPSNRRWLEKWWQPRADYKAMLPHVTCNDRTVGCSQTAGRAIFFMFSTQFIPTNKVQLFAISDDYGFGLLQSSLHWEWTRARGGGGDVNKDIRYKSAVWNTFPWPQAPTLQDVIGVAGAAQQLRATRDRLMAENGWSLRALYQASEVEGPHPLKDAQAALDAAVEAAYGKPADQEATEFLLELNLALAEDEDAGETIQGPGLPLVDGEPLDPKDPRWFSTDCIEPPPLPTLDDEPKDEVDSDG